VKEHELLDEREFRALSSTINPMLTKDAQINQNGIPQHNSIQNNGNGAPPPTATQNNSNGNGAPPPTATQNVNNGNGALPPTPTQYNNNVNGPTAPNPTHINVNGATAPNPTQINVNGATPPNVLPRLTRAHYRVASELGLCVSSHRLTTIFIDGNGVLRLR